MITISYKSREVKKKRDTKRLRRAGFIPFVVYSGGNEAIYGSAPRMEIDAVMRNLRSGFLPTTRFSLKDEKGVSRTVVPREIQYKPTTYEIEHIDFLELHNEIPIEIKVPVELTGTIDCVGIKLGGFLQNVMRHVKVKCLPKNIPSFFEIDVRELNIGQTKRVRDIVIPSDVTCMDEEDRVVVTIGKY